MSVGVAGVRALPAALTMYERPDLTYLMMTQKSYPGSGFMIESGATSLWEYWEHYDWDGVGQGGSNPRYFRALNHCFLGGGFSTWVYADLLGITAAEAGYDRIQIRPQIPGDLTYAKGQVETVHGTVKVDWIVDETGNLTMKVTVPANTVAEVYVPIRGEGANVTITEGDDVWFARGEAAVDTYVETTDTHVHFRLGSGEYIFTMSGEGTYPFA
jgi:alpha-L-rhamnosidase